MLPGVFFEQLWSVFGVLVQGHAWRRSIFRSFVEYFAAASSPPREYKLLKLVSVQSYPQAAPRKVSCGRSLRSASSSHSRELPPADTRELTPPQTAAKIDANIVGAIRFLNFTGTAATFIYMFNLVAGRPRVYSFSQALAHRSRHRVRGMGRSGIGWGARLWALWRECREQGFPKDNEDTYLCDRRLRRAEPSGVEDDGLWADQCTPTHHHTRT